MKKWIAPSILSADLNQLFKEIRAVEEAGADLIHVDVMDGHFVPNITFGSIIVQHLSQITSKPLDVHLMIENPQNHLESFVKAGASFISVHFEALKDPIQILKQAQDLNIRFGLALKPETPVENIFPFLKNLDFVLIMMVEPGLSGQKMIVSQNIKIQKLQKQMSNIGHFVKIEVDGGVNDQTFKWVQSADIFVSGHYIFKNQNYSKAILNLRKMAQCS